MKSEGQLPRKPTFKTLGLTPAHGTKRTLRFDTPGSENGHILTLTRIRNINLRYSLLIIMAIGKYKREPHDFQVFPIAGGKRLVKMPSIIVIFV
jgi:hypothetical protein